MKNLLSIVIILTVTLIGFGQEILTNDKIVEMVEAKLPETVIIAKIKASVTNFKTELSDLKELSEKKVPDSVIASMVEKQPKEVEFKLTDAEYGNLSEISGKTKIYLANIEMESRKIIVKELSKYPEFQLVDSRSACDFAITLKLQNVDTGNAFRHNYILVGDFFVYTYLPVRESDTFGHVRVLWHKRREKGLIGKHPALSVNDFLKDFKGKN